MNASRNVGIQSEHVSQIACAQCQQRLDVSQLPSFSQVTCPSCGLAQIVPARFGGFWLVGELGAGGMGVIFHALDKELGRHVALKVMKRELGANAEFVQSFKHEAQAAAALNHPNVVQIYSFGQVEGQPYIAMELVSGGRLDEMIGDGQAVEETRALEIHLQVVAGLKAASDVGLVHGDIKPANILFGQNGEAKVVDFGLASFVGQQSGGPVWGTPYYIAPEKARGKRVDFRSDIYSLGATLFHVLTGQPPFDGATSTDVVMARLGQPAPRISERTPDVHPATDALVARMLEMEPTMRYPSYPALQVDMEAALAESRTPLKKTPSSVVAVAAAIRPPRLSRRVLIGIGIGTAAAALLAALAWGGYRYTQRREQLAAEAAEQARRAAIVADGESAFERLTGLAGVVAQRGDTLAPMLDRIRKTARALTNDNPAVLRADLAADALAEIFNAAEDLRAAADIALQELRAAPTPAAAGAAAQRMDACFTELIRNHNLLQQHEQDAEAALKEALARQASVTDAARRAREAAAAAAARKKAEEQARLQAQKEAEEAERNRPRIIQAELDLVDETRAAAAGRIARYQFEEAAASVDAIRSRLTLPETQARGEALGEAFRALAGLKAFLLESIQKDPCRRGWMTGSTARDIVKASEAQGLVVALGAAGTMIVPWDQVTPPAFLRIAARCLDQPSLTDAARAESLLAMALLAYETRDFKTAESYVAAACALEADLAGRADRLMPGFTEASAP